MLPQAESWKTVVDDAQVRDVGVGGGLEVDGWMKRAREWWSVSVRRRLFRTFWSEGFYFRGRNTKREVIYFPLLLGYTLDYTLGVLFLEL